MSNTVIEKDWMRDSHGYKGLSKAEESDLVKKYQRKGCRVSLEKLVLNNFGAIRKKARAEETTTTFDFEDNLAAATYGYIVGLQKFNTKKNVKASTYALWWARSHMGRDRVNNGHPIRIPVGTYEKLRTAYKSIEEQQKEEQRLLTRAEIQDRIPANLHHVLEPDLVRLDAGLGIEDRLPHIDLTTEREREFSLLEEAIKSLSEEERYMVTRFYGIGCEQIVGKAIAKQLGCSANTLYSRLAKLLDRLRAAITEGMEDGL